MRWPLLAVLATALTACSSDPPLPAPAATALAITTPPVAAPLLRCQRSGAPGTQKPLDSPGTGSAIALARSGARTIAFAADADSDAIHAVDLDTRAPLATTPLSGSPAQILITREGLVIAALRDHAAIELLEPTDEPGQLRSLCTVPTPAEPVALALSPDGATLLVASRWGHALSAFATERLEARFTLDLPRDPASVAVSPDGAHAYVAHAVGGRISVVDLGATTPTAARDLPLRVLRQVDQSSLCVKDASVVVHPLTFEQSFSLLVTGDGRVLAPGVLVDPWPILDGAAVYGGRSYSREPSTTFTVATLGASSEKASFARSPAQGLADCLLPRAAALREASDELLVTCLGRDELVAYDARPTAVTKRARRRWKVGRGPTGVAVDRGADRAVVWSQFEGALSLISLADKGAPPERIALAAHTPLDPQLELGRRLFHAADSSKIASDGRACASCHLDGRDDGLSWVTRDGPRQTPMLLGRLEGTAPYGWQGEHKTLHVHFSATLLRLGGAGLDESERDAIFARVQSLRPPEEPARPENAEIARGKTLFHADDTSCAACHRGELTTDLARHDVMTGTRYGISRFDVPSLRFVGRSAPYLHDGRYPTLRAMLDGMDGKMGFTKHLSSEDRDALAAYVESL